MIFSLLLATIFTLQSSIVFAAMTSTNYQIQWDSISSGGGESSSTSFNLRDEIGSQSDATSASLNYGVQQGFRSGTYDRVVSFAPYIQDRTSQVAATNFVSQTVTVTLATGFSVDDYILIVQNEGAGQVALMGRVTSIAGSDIVIASDYSGSLPTIDGSNDFVYLMSRTASIGFGTLSSTFVSTHVVGWVSTSDVVDGYSVFMYSNQDFSNGLEIIGGVSDGSVTAGVSEYGGRSSDTTLVESTFDTEDSPFSTMPVLVGSKDAHPFDTSDFVTLKASIASDQAGGTYSQTLYLIFVGEY